MGYIRARESRGPHALARFFSLFRTRDAPSQLPPPQAPSSFSRRLSPPPLPALLPPKLGPWQQVVGFDMGGTSTDVSRYAGQLEHLLEATVAGVTIQAPQLDINTVAAGGGSRLLLRSGGLFAVGPESVGAEPGPACYRKARTPAAFRRSNSIISLPLFLVQQREHREKVAHLQPKNVADANKHINRLAGRRPSPTPTWCWAGCSRPSSPPSSAQSAPPPPAPSLVPHAGSAPGLLHRVPHSRHVP